MSLRPTIYLGRVSLIGKASALSSAYPSSECCDSLANVGSGADRRWQASQESVLFAAELRLQVFYTPIYTFLIGYIRNILHTLS